MRTSILRITRTISCERIVLKARKPINLHSYRSINFINYYSTQWRLAVTDGEQTYDVKNCGGRPLTPSVLAISHRCWLRVANYQSAADRSRQGQCHSDAAVRTANCKKTSGECGCASVVRICVWEREYPVTRPPSYRTRPSSTYAHVRTYVMSATAAGPLTVDRSL